MAAAAILDFCTMLILAVNLTVGPYFRPMFQTWCKCAQKWPSYGQKFDFQYGGRRHLGFCWIRVLRAKAVQGPYSLCLCQIWCTSIQKWRSYGRLTDFKMAAAAILDFCTMWILAVNMTVGPHLVCQRAINNIYRSLGVPQRESVYVRSTLNTLSTIQWTQVYRRLFNNPQSFDAPPQGTLANIPNVPYISRN